MYWPRSCCNHYYVNELNDFYFFYNVGYGACGRWIPSTLSSGLYFTVSFSEWSMFVLINNFFRSGQPIIYYCYKDRYPGSMDICCMF